MFGGGAAVHWDTYIDPSRDVSFSAQPIGAGGQITGIDIAADGTKVCRCDTYGAYYFDQTLSGVGNAHVAGGWKLLQTLQAMPAGDLTIGGGINSAATSKQDGVVEIVIAPGNTSRFYMMFNGYIFRTDNRGAAWTRTAFAQVLDSFSNPPSANNPNTKGKSKFIAVDPANANVVYASTLLAELRVSTDAGASWSTVTGVGNAGSNSGHLIAFDPSSSASGGKTQGIYVFTHDTGLFHSTDGGINWTRITGAGQGSPQVGLTTCTKLIATSDGYVYVIDGNQSDTSFWRQHSGSWINPTVTGGNGANGWSTIVVDPSNLARIIIAAGFGLPNISLDHGATWTGTLQYASGGTRVATDTPWLATTFASSIGVSHMEFDPTGANKLYIAAGIGVFWGNVPNTDAPWNWNSQSANIEQMVCNKVIVPPGGKLNSIFWDRPQFYSASDTVFPSNQGPDNNSGYGSNPTDIVMGADIDFATGTPTTLALLSTGNISSIDTSGISTDGGQTFTAFSAFPDIAPGGFIGMASPTKIARVAGDTTSKLYYSSDAGATWHLATVPAAVPTSGDIGWSPNAFNWYGLIHRFATDRVINTAGIYKIYAVNNSAGGVGVYSSTDGGANWTRVRSSAIGGGGDFFHFKSVPGHGGHLWLAEGTGNTGAANSYISTDGGVTFTLISGVFIGAYGFGVVYPGQSYPSILMIGYIGGVAGVYLCTNFNPATASGTWINVTSNGNGYYSGDMPVDIDGDKSKQGLFYIGLKGSNVIRCQL